jgi:ABC-type hemin transport system substrate-binding protein
MTKSLEELSAAELFELAQRRQQEEKDRQREALKEQVEGLRTKRRDAVTRHKKELAAIDAEIRALSGAGRPARARGKVNVSQKVIEIIGGKGTASTTDIKKALDDEGIAAGNLSQTLAYLKRMGRVVSAGRANYKLA